MNHIDVVWKLAQGVEVGQALKFATNRFNEEAIESASLDAQLLLSHVLGVERTWLFAHHEHPLTPEQAESFTALIMRRMRHEPIAYLIKRKEFYGLDFIIDHRVLVPRPETELLVDHVLDELSLFKHKPVYVADVGTGSGAIALSIAANNPDVRVFAIDISEDALDLAESNVLRLDSRNQVTLLCGDLLTPLSEPVDMIVANLPYISSKLYAVLDPDVRNYEPRLALESGPEGLDAIHRLLEQAASYLRPGGQIFLEIAYDQGKIVETMAKRYFPRAHFIRIYKDYHDHDRIVRIVL